MKVALLVEGSRVFHVRTGGDLLVQLWRDALRRVIGYVQPDHVLGITKGSIVAMRLKGKALRRTTSIAEPLDQLMERSRRLHGIDCFLVVWDLLPPWDREEQTCRWTETQALYEGLSLSSDLDPQFRDFAAARLVELRARAHPGARLAPPRLIPGSVLAVCMEPLFESAFMDEQAMKACLGVRGRRARGWPTGWDPTNVHAERVIAAAVEAARESLPGAPLFRRIRDGYATLKTEWGIHFAQSSHFDKALRASNFGKRLAELRVR